MNIFGDFYNQAYSFRRSKREQGVQQSEDWSAAVLSGSDERASLEQALPASYIRFFLIGAVLLTIVLVAQLFYLQITKGKQNLVLANGNRIRQAVIHAPRGTIYDRSKQVLARNMASFDLVVNPAQLPAKAPDRAIVYAKAATLLGMQPQEVSKQAEAKGLYFPQNILIKANLDRDQALNIEEQSHALTGFSIDINPTREYLDGGALAAFLGYTGRISAEEWKANPQYQLTDYIGKTGLEQAYEPDLKGVDGHKQVEVDVKGREIRELASTAASPGDSLVLSIDNGLEKKMAQAVAAGVQAAGASRGTAVAMNPMTGEILGAVNVPSYDNNLFAKGISQADYQHLLKDPGQPLFNKAIAGRYPVGSTIKPFVSLAALESNVINAATSFDDTGKLQVPNQYNPSIVYTFNGWNPAGLGVVNVVRALQWSSDIFFYIVGGGYKDFRGLGVDRLTSWYHKFGFASKTGIDIQNESAGYVPSPSDKKARTGEAWTVGDTYNISIGQGDLQLTPLQLVTAFSAIANGGTIYKPHLVNQIVNAEGKTVRTIQPQAVTSNFINPQNLAMVQQGLKDAVDSGTACCRIKQEVPVQVAGKTGSAETSSAGQDGKGVRTAADAWFEAYAPADHPQIALVVLIENAGEGAEYATPVSREILKWYFGGRP